MLFYALLFLVATVVAGFLGFGGVLGGTAATYAEALFLLFLALFVISLLRGSKPRV